RHVPPWQRPWVHRSARHAVPLGWSVKIQPCARSHRPIWHEPKGLQGASSGTCWHAPDTGLQVSAVQSNPSSQAGGCVHFPASQTSVVQMFPSLAHGGPESGWQPPVGMQVSPVHGSPSPGQGTSNLHWFGTQPSHQSWLPSSQSSPGSSCPLLQQYGVVASVVGFAGGWITAPCWIVTTPSRVVRSFLLSAKSRGLDSSLIWPAVSVLVPRPPPRESGVPLPVSVQFGPMSMLPPNVAPLLVTSRVPRTTAGPGKSPMRIDPCCLALIALVASMVRPVTASSSTVPPPPPLSGFTVMSPRSSSELRGPRVPAPPSLPPAVPVASSFPVL